MPTIPNNFPTPKVTIIAKTPPITTRTIAFILSALPAWALNIPVMIRATTTDQNVTRTRTEAGAKIIAKIGTIAPEKKARPEA